MRRLLLSAIVAVALLPACAVKAGSKGNTLDEAALAEVAARARVWQPTRVRAMNLRTGPGGTGSFTPNELVRCTYVRRETDGQTPKFVCRLADGGEVKVKFGRDNGEVFAEVAATRLLWALGFGADHMYPVRVDCQGCPESDGNDAAARPGVTRFDFAAIERKMPGRELEGPNGPGWSWDDLDRGNPSGARLIQRDALKLLAVLLQHTDSKREQQRLVCLGETGRGREGETRRGLEAETGRGRAADCRRPFLLISDLGKTFGRANAFNRDAPGSVNLAAWAESPVWAGSTGCTGNLPKSLTGTLDNPTITDAGRRFLADLLAQLSDRQLHDLFEVARFPARTGGAESQADVRAWVAAFKDKVRQVAQRSCLQDRRTQ